MTRALVVAPNNWDRQRYKSILEEIGFDVMDKPRTGVEAQILFRALKPDMVVLEYLLPELAGIELLRSMKNDNDMTTVLMVTPVWSRIVIEKAFRFKAEDVLVKPFSDQEFAASVMQLREIGLRRSQNLGVK